jgi:hypothetical protein
MCVNVFDLLLGKNIDTGQNIGKLISHGNNSCMNGLMENLNPDKPELNVASILTWLPINTKYIL